MMKQQRVVAQPVLDTRLESQSQETRGARWAPVHRKMYKAPGNVRVDIQQEDLDGGRVLLEGQVLIRGRGLEDVSEAGVALQQTGARILKTITDSIGSFTFPEVTPGRHELSITMTNLEIIVPGIEV